MLEQPPERTQMEIEAEAAAAAMQDTRRQPHGCVRPLVWLMPTLVFYGMMFGVGVGFNAFLPGVDERIVLIVFGMLVLGATYGLGCFDGVFSPKTFVPSPSERQRLILMHGLYFTAHQIWLIPAISVVLFGACMAIATY